MIPCRLCGAPLSWDISGLWFHVDGRRDGDHEATPDPPPAEESARVEPGPPVSMREEGIN
jgi:hypothetical protein